MSDSELRWRRPKSATAHRVQTMARLVVAAAFLLSGILLGPTPANADPAGPTDYRSEVLSVTPPTDDISFRFIGGDSFLEMTNKSSSEIEVIGYYGEPYLSFKPGGLVEQNENSPTVTVNEDRYGELDSAIDTSADLAADWQEVADGGTYAWHDHRTHWMNRAKPPGKSPGDQVLEAVVPIRVDGQEVDVLVASYLLDSPGTTTWVSVVAAAVVAALLVAYAGWKQNWLPGLVAATCALAAGTVAFFSVPTVTSPQTSLWTLPLVACFTLVAAMVIARKSTSGSAKNRTRSQLFASGLAAIGGIELVLWAYGRRDTISRALIPSEVPSFIDRALVAVGFGAGLAAAAVGIALAISSVRSGSQPSTST